MKTSARIALTLVILVATAFAQSGAVNPADTAASINQRGFGARNSPALRAGGATTVMGSRSFTYPVEMFSLPGRHGLNLNLSLVYNSLIWNSVLATPSVSYNPDPDSATHSPGFRLDFGYLLWYQSFGITTGILVDPHGTKHSLTNSGNFALFNTTDSTYISVQHHASTGSNDQPSDVVTYKNGLQVFYQFGVNNIADGSTVMQPVKIEDASGT